MHDWFISTEYTDDSKNEDKNNDEWQIMERENKGPSHYSRISSLLSYHIYAIMH